MQKPVCGYQMNLASLNKSSVTRLEPKWIPFLTFDQNADVNVSCYYTQTSHNKTQK